MSLLAQLRCACPGTGPRAACAARLDCTWRRGGARRFSCTCRLGAGRWRHCVLVARIVSHELCNEWVPLLRPHGVQMAWRVAHSRVSSNASSSTIGPACAGARCPLLSARHHRGIVAGRAIATPAPPPAELSRRRVGCRTACARFGVLLKSVQLTEEAFCSRLVEGTGKQAVHKRSESFHCSRNVATDSQRPVCTHTYYQHIYTSARHARMNPNTADQAVHAVDETSSVTAIDGHPSTAACTTVSYAMAACTHVTPRPSRTKYEIPAMAGVTRTLIVSG